MKRTLRFTVLFFASCILVLLGFAVFYPFMQFEFTRPPSWENQHQVKIIGHRGAAGLAPENTLASFQKALDLGVDMIELDVHLTGDNEVVVMHDSNVKRTTNGKGEIEDLTLDEINDLDAGSWFSPHYKDQKVPTLREVIDLVQGKAQLLIELKWPRSGTYQDLVPELMKIMKEKNAQSWVQIISFEPSYLTEALSMKPEVKCHQLIFGLSRFIPVYFDRSIRFGYFRPLQGVDSVYLYYRYLNSQLAKKLIDQEMAVGVFTVNDEKSMLKALSMGASSIITDYPNLAIPLIRN